MRIVVALGGNAILQRDDAGTAAEMRAAARDACTGIAALAREHEIVVTHGNGPQVGLLLEQNELAAPRLPEMPLDVLVAETQGMLGYVLQQELNAELVRARVRRQAVTIVTQVIVRADDRAFTFPTKPIGPFLSREAGKALKAAGASVVDVGAGKWRRTVPSPMPVKVVEDRIISAALSAGYIPIAAGGGGIPVVAEGSGVRGVAGVIDKDRTAALLAKSLKVDLLLILTDVDAVLVEGKPVRSLAADHAALALAAGAFPPGSMGPKIEAALDARAAGARAVIAGLDHAVDAVAGKAGTEID